MRKSEGQKIPEKEIANFWFVGENKMLKIRDFIFQDDWEDRRSCLMFFKADREESASWAVDIGFKTGDFEGNEISPSICINPIDTDKSTVKGGDYIFSKDS